MSLQQTLNKVINEYLQNFFQNIIARHPNISIEELEKLWNTSGVVSSTPKEEEEDCSKFLDIPTDITQEYLLKCLKPELIGLCKKYNVKTTGTKNELLCALREKLFSNPKVVEETSSIVKSSSKKTVEPVPVIKKLLATIPTVAISRNKFGNHEHSETSLIFDKKSKKVIGKQNSDGSIDELTEDDINLCNKYKFEYILPSNLDNNTKNNITIDELDDEEIVESDDDLDEEELLEEEDELEEDDDFDDY